MQKNIQKTTHREGLKSARYVRQLEHIKTILKKHYPTIDEEDFDWMVEQQKTRKYITSEEWVKFYNLNNEEKNHRTK